MTPIECPRCGKINDGTTDFCIYCGTIYEEYNPEEDDFNIFSIPKKSNYRMRSNLILPQKIFIRKRKLQMDDYHRLPICNIR